MPVTAQEPSFAQRVVIIAKPAHKDVVLPVRSTFEKAFFIVPPLLFHKRRGAKASPLA
jgi:hypothetical protein